MLGKVGRYMCVSNIFEKKICLVQWPTIDLDNIVLNWWELTQKNRSQSVLVFQANSPALPAVNCKFHLVYGHF